MFYYLHQMFCSFSATVYQTFFAEAAFLLLPVLSDLETLDIEVSNKQYSRGFSKIENEISLEFFLLNYLTSTYMQHIVSKSSIKDCCFPIILLFGISIALIKIPEFWTSNPMLRDAREWFTKLHFIVVMWCFKW